MPLNRLPGIEGAAIRPQEELRPRIGERLRDVGRPAAGDPASGFPHRTGFRSEPGLGDVPAGVDPGVWLGLSVEERAFFARLEAAGPLSYAPNTQEGEPEFFRGRHLFIRV
jgi:hypothetical protein